MFSTSVCEQIEYYVYYLIDPRNGKVFYVGKGKDNRVFQHVAGAVEKNAKTEKTAIIREIISQGYEVEHQILRHGLTEKVALEVEAAVIDFVGLEQLTNEVTGHDAYERGKMSAQEIEAIYDAEEVEITDPVMAIIINRLFRRNMSPEDLYNATRSAWKVGMRRKTVRYVLSVYRGIVREVYEVDRWREKLNEKGRWEFEGRVADCLIRNKYINKSLGKYIHKGNQSPIRYLP